MLLERSAILEKVRQMIGHITAGELDEERVTVEASFAQLGLDSLEMMELRRDAV